MVISSNDWDHYGSLCPVAGSIMELFKFVGAHCSVAVIILGNVALCPADGAIWLSLVSLVGVSG